MSEETNGLANKLTRVYIKIRDARSELKRKFDAEDKELKEQQEKVKIALLDYCKEHDVESVKTASGTFFRQVKTRYWTDDWEEMHKFILEHDVIHFLDKRLNQTAVREFLEENPDVTPESLKTSREYQINVRKK